MSTDRISIAFRDIPPAVVERLANPVGHPDGVGLDEMSVDGELGDGRSSLVLSALLAIATGVPSGVAANWVWKRLDDGGGVVHVIVIGHETCYIRSADELEKAFDKTRN